MEGLLFGSKGGDELRAEEQEEGRWIVGNYQILQKIGQGGSGEIYLVRYIPTGQIRVAKHYHSDKRNGCLRELRAMRNLHHSSLPAILDVLRTEQADWLIMEYVPGRCLKDIPEASFSCEQFLELAEQLAELLVYLHSRTPAILHLDIKPSNLIINAQNRLILLDFGAAVLKNGQGEKNPCLGTPGFAAPEQKNEDIVLDGRADIYGYGAVLNWYLSRMPVHGYARIAEGRHWKRKIRKVIQKSMQYEREHRYADSKAVLKNIQEIKRNRRIRRRSWTIAGAAFLLIALLVFTGFSWTEEKKKNMAAEQDHYEDLLGKAELLGFETAAEYYRETAERFPGQTEWCMHLVDRIGTDAVFDLQEEALLKELLFQMVPGEGQTTIDLLGQQKTYPYLAFRIGMNYWYYYAGNGGKSAAVRWFEKAVSSAESILETEEWTDIARLHIRIQRYYEQNTGSSAAEQYSDYWEELANLWEMNSFSEEDVDIRLQTAEEIISGIIMYSAELKRSGKTGEELKQIMEQIKIFAGQEGVPEQMNELLEHAVLAVERTFPAEDSDRYEVPSDLISSES